MFDDNRSYYMLGCNKNLKGIIHSITSVLLVMLLTFCTACGESVEEFARDPQKIVGKAGFNMPPYTVKYSVSDVSSKVHDWSNFMYQLQFDDKLSGDDISALDRLVKKDRNWKFLSNDSIYAYKFQSPDDKDIIISINVKSGEAYVRCSWKTLFN